MKKLEIKTPFQINQISSLVFGLVFSCTTFAAPTEIKIAGATETSLDWIKKIQTEVETQASVKLDFRRYQAKLAVANLAKGVTDGFTGPDINNFLKEAIADGLSSEYRADQFKKTLIGKSITFIALHPDNPLNQITKSQIAGILNGSITSWEDVGGSGGKIVFITQSDQSGLWKRLEKVYLDGGQTRKPDEEVKDSTGQMRALSRNKNGITFYTTVPAKIENFAPKSIKTELENDIFLWIKNDARSSMTKVFEIVQKKGRLDLLK